MEYTQILTKIVFYISGSLVVCADLKCELSWVRVDWDLLDFFVFALSLNEQRSNLLDLPLTCFSTRMRGK